MSSIHNKSDKLLRVHQDKCTDFAVEAMQAHGTCWRSLDGLVHLLPPHNDFHNRISSQKDFQVLRKKKCLTHEDFQHFSPTITIFGSAGVACRVLNMVCCICFLLVCPQFPDQGGYSGQSVYVTKRINGQMNDHQSQKTESLEPDKRGSKQGYPTGDFFPKVLQIIENIHLLLLSYLISPFPAVLSCSFSLFPAAGD